MEPTESIAIRASKDVVSQIDTLAAGMDRSRNYVVNQAIQQYLAYHHVLHQKIEQGHGGPACDIPRRARHSGPVAMLVHLQ